MKFKCPHCSRTLSLSDDKLREYLPDDDTQAEDDTQSGRQVWIMIIIVATALAGTVGFGGGALLTRPTRNRTAAKIESVRATAAEEVQQATRTAEQATKNAQQATAKTRQLQATAKTRQLEATAKTRQLEAQVKALHLRIANLTKDSQLDSSDSLRLAGKQEVPSPENINNKDWEIVDIEVKITERNDVYWQFSWRLTMKNNVAQTKRLSGEVEFQDADGFIVDTDSLYNIIVPANSSKTFTGSAMVTARIAPNIAGTVVKLHE